MPTRYVGPSQDELEDTRAAIQRAYDDLSDHERAVVDALCRRLERYGVGPKTSLEIVGKLGMLAAKAVRG